MVWLGSRLGGRLTFRADNIGSLDCATHASAIDAIFQWLVGWLRGYQMQIHHRPPFPRTTTMNLRQLSWGEICTAEGIFLLQHLKTNRNLINSHSPRWCTKTEVVLWQHYRPQLSFFSTLTRGHVVRFCFSFPVQPQGSTSRRPPFLGQTPSSAANLTPFTKTFQRERLKTSCFLTVCNI